MAVPFPEMPPEIRKDMPDAFWHWWQAFRSYMLANLFTFGNVETMTPGAGVVVASPNGTRWLVAVDNTGAVTTTAL